MSNPTAGAREDDELLKWDGPPSPEEIERRRQLLAEIRTLRNHPLTEEEQEFWREFDEELALERDRGRGIWPPLNAPVTPEEMEHRRRVVAHLEAAMAKPATEEDEKLWQEFLALGR